MPERWIITPRPNGLAASRLVCFAHAGGGVGAFSGWGERLPSAEVGIVQLPGRGSRAREPLLESVAAAAQGVADAIRRSPARPTALFGHGLGALVAFETARRLRDAGWPLVTLFVSGCRAPSLHGGSGPAPAGLPLEQLVAEVCRRGDALAEAVFADTDMMDALVTWLRADLTMAEAYRYEPGAPLDCPIVACGGSSDPSASRAELEGWRQETRSRLGVHLFTGGHLYLIPERTAVTRLIANQLSVVLGALARGRGAFTALPPRSGR